MSRVAGGGRLAHKYDFKCYISKHGPLAQQLAINWSDHHRLGPKSLLILKNRMIAVYGEPVDLLPCNQQQQRLKVRHEAQRDNTMYARLSTVDGPPCRGATAIANMRQA
jgi:hypothetical protein